MKSGSLFISALFYGLLMLVNPVVSLAGSPFLTDDPEPGEYRHLEFYIASQSQITRHTKNITTPHFEINYGVLPDVQLHLITPFCYSQNDEVKHYGYGDTELGIKWRFMNESEYIPMIGIFPMVQVPTGNEKKGVGNGNAQYYIPLWIQKKWEKWLSYGGGGYWINQGKNNNNYWFAGWQIQRQIKESLSLGIEVFHRKASKSGDKNSTGFNIGAVINFSELHHMLFSAGRDVVGPNTFTSYVSYQLTIGPGDFE